MSVIYYLQENPIMWAFLALCTVLAIPAIIISVYTLIIGKRRREFTYAQTTYQVVKSGVSSINKLKLLFNENPIPDLTITRFSIWNSGTEEIRKEDLYFAKPLRIKSLGDTVILDASIIQESDPEHKFEIISINDKDILINFECAEKQDGVVIEVIHSGNADELKPDVGIKGGRSGKEIRDYQANSKAKIESNKWNRTGVIFKGLSVIVVIVYTVIIILDQLHIISLPVSTPEQIKRTNQLLTWFQFPLVVIACFLYIDIVKTTYHLSIPSRLRKYVEVELSS